MTFNRPRLIAGPAIQLKFVAEDLREVPQDSLLDYAQFLVDLNLAYEISRIVHDPAYAGFRFSPSTFSRSGRRLESEDCFRVHRITLNSPLQIEAYLPYVPVVIATIWGFMQIVEKVISIGPEQAKRKLDVEKVRLEIKKLQRDLDGPGLLLPNRTPAPLDISDRPDATRAVERAAERLQESPLALTSIDVDLIRQLEG